MKNKVGRFLLSISRLTLKLHQSKHCGKITSTQINGEELSSDYGKLIFQKV